MLHLVKNTGKCIFYGIANGKQVPILPGSSAETELIPEIQRRIDIKLAENLGEVKVPELKTIIRKSK